jgi:hypothetical protein
LGEGRTIFVTFTNGEFIYWEPFIGEKIDAPDVRQLPATSVILGVRFFLNCPNLESETFWGRNQAEDLRFSLARRSAKATHSSTSFLSRL